MGVFEKVPLSRLPEMGVPPKKILRMSVADSNIRGVTLLFPNQIGLMTLHTCLSFFYSISEQRGRTSMGERVGLAQGLLVLFSASLVNR